MKQSLNSDTDDLLARLQGALAGTHGRDVSVDAVRSLLAMEVSEWNAERSPTPKRYDIPLIGHPIRLSSS